jgi:hypothetical protein
MCVEEIERDGEIDRQFVPISHGRCDERQVTVFMCLYVYPILLLVGLLMSRM